MKDKKILNSQFSILNFHESGQARLPSASPQANGGQALLVILLIMAVALTIGLSITSRSITDIKISELSEEGARAFSAAEAGIEEALLTYSGSPGWVPIGDAAYQTATAEIGSGTSFVFPQKVEKNQTQTLYLAKYGTDGNLSSHYTKNSIDVCWDGNAALEVGVYFQEGTSYKVWRYALDPILARRVENSFSPPDSGSCAGLARKKTLSLPSGSGITLLFLRLRILYESTKVGVVGGGSGGSLPSQGIQIDSTGQAGEAMRKVRVIRYHPAPPPFFDMVLYSQTDLKK